MANTVNKKPMDIQILSPYIANIVNTKDGLHYTLETKNAHKYEFHMYNLDNTKEYLSGYLIRKFNPKKKRIDLYTMFSVYDGIPIDSDEKTHILDSFAGFFASSEYQNSVMNRHFQLQHANSQKHKYEKQINTGTRKLKNISRIVQKLNYKFNNGKITGKDTTYATKSSNYVK